MTESTTSNRIALVAGATGAIGATALELLTSRGWIVVATHRTGEPPSSKGVHWVRFDGALDADVHPLRDVLSSLPGALSAVVCTIGQPSSKKTVAETAPTEFTSVFDANVTSVVRLWRAAHESARKGRAGVVLLGSDTTATLRPRNGAYSAAKAALEALAQTMAAEEAQHGVRVNVVAPSLVASPLAENVLALRGIVDPVSHYLGLPWGRALTVQEVAQIAVDLASSAQWEYVSGQTIRIAARTQ